MPRLVVEEEVGLELAQELALRQAAEEHRLVDLDVPVHQRADRALVRRRAARGDQRGAHAHGVAGVALQPLQRLEQRLEGPGGSGVVACSRSCAWNASRPLRWNTRSASSENSTASPSKAMRTSSGCASERVPNAGRRARPESRRRAPSARPRRSPTGTGARRAASGSATGAPAREHAALDRQAVGLTERNTRSPRPGRCATGSPLRRAAVAERQQLAHQRNATPGLAGLSRRSSCSAM